MSEDQMKRIAFVGCAHIHTPAFVNKLKERNDMQVVGVWDHDAARAKKNADQFSCGTYVSHNEIWKDKSIDAVVICSETNLHKELAMAAAKAGKHMFIEKPLGFAGKDAFAVARAIEKAGVIFQTGYFNRGVPAHLFLKKMVDNGSFGKITRIRHTNCHSGSLGGWFDTEWRWMADPSIAGCGGFGDLGTHSLDIIMWLMGMPEKVTGDISVVTGRYGSDCDEAGEAMLKFPNGAIGTVAASWVDLANPITCEITGTKAYAYIHYGKLYVKCEGISDGANPVTDLPAALPHAFDLFLDALNGKTVSLVTVAEAAQRSSVMEAIYKGAKSGKWVAPAVY